MLNRRILRAKAVQYLYGLLQSHNANFELAIENIRDDFAPDLNSMEPQDRIQLAKDAQKAIEIFEQSVVHKTPVDPHTENKLKKSVINAQLFLKNAIARDNKFSATSLVNQTEEVHNSYVLSLYILVKVLSFIEDTFNKKYNTPDKEFAIKKLIFRNFEVAGTKLGEETEEKVSDLAFILYRDVFSLNENLESVYINKLGQIDAEKEVVKDLIKIELLKNDFYESIMEEEDFDWSENKSAVKDLINKTLKNISEDSEPSRILISISANWDDDKQFMQELFLKSVENKEEYTTYINEKLKNWDLSRIAEIDLAILYVAIAEMINFPSIPVKVSINEYLEIAKVYSTPKSKDFINGLLDKISVDLVDKEVIKKSGRGLIDNK